MAVITSDKTYVESARGSSTMTSSLEESLALRSRACKTCASKKSESVSRSCLHPPQEDRDSEQMGILKAKFTCTILYII